MLVPKNLANLRKKNLQYSYRLYLNSAGKRVLGKGGAQILEAIDEHGSIAAAAEKLGMSYKFVWDYLIRIRKILKEPIIITHRGGTGHRRKKGGGGAVLTPLARTLLKEFRSTEGLVNDILSYEKRSVILPRFSATNRRMRKVKSKIRSSTPVMC